MIIRNINGILYFSRSLEYILKIAAGRSEGGREAISRPLRI